MRNPALQLALLGSVALHAVLLWGLPFRMAPPALPETAEPLIARLAQTPSPEPKPPPAPPVAAPTTPPPKPPAPPAAPKKRKAVPAVKKEAQKPVSPPQPSEPPQEAEQVRVPERAPPANADPPRQPTPAPALAFPAPELAPPPQKGEAAGEDATIADYRAQILGAARKFKRYPGVARDNAWEGEVVVRLLVDSDGAATSIELAASSGHAVLDRQALDMFKRAVRLVPVPPQLKGKAFSVQLRAVYRLSDQESG